MATVIQNQRQDGIATKRARGKEPILPDGVASLLPPLLVAEILSVLCQGERLEELRFRRCRRASVTVDGTNRVLRFVTDGALLDGLLVKLCQGSLYAHRESLRRGYVTVKGGIRVGICGRAVTEDERMDGVYDVSGLNIRLPCAVFRCGDPIAQRLRRGTGTEGVLIFSPPGEGKTTLLRGLILNLASGEDGLCTSVIDTREELLAGMDREDLLIDWFCGYPKSVGMEIAVRCMRPELLVCDEIGDGEADAILGAQNAGVPLLATAHASSVEGLLCRPGFAQLHRARVFGAYVRIRRVPHKFAFDYEITEWEDANERLQHIGRHSSATVRGDGSKHDESLG